ncbi:hypothetical protein QE152_g4412 [Popillia japonica]|uniref:Uncharacterized protein n=1 Tax=Popillia japonica TaxID=7064 RepID=A0AAW1N0V2_POPJA
MLAKLAPDLSRWDEVLDRAEFALNNSIQTATGQCPSKLLFGVEQKGEDELKHYFNNTFNNTEGKEENLEENYYDRKHLESPIFNIGDFVMIPNVEIAPGLNKKLLPQFKRPYIIKKCLDHDRYLIKDIDGYQMTQIPSKEYWQEAS